MRELPQLPPRGRLYLAIGVPYCQWPVGSPRGRPVIVPAGGQLVFPNGGQLFPHQGQRSGFTPSPLVAWVSR